MYLAHAFQPHHWHVSLLPLLPGSMLAVARCQSCHPSNEGGLTSGNSVVDLMSAHLPSLWAFAGLTSESTNQSLICGANATWRWQSGSLGAHTHPPTTGWTWCLILQHVLSTWVLLLMTCLYMCSICIMYGRCLTVAVGPDSCTVQLSCACYTRHFLHGWHLVCVACKPTKSWWNASLAGHLVFAGGTHGTAPWGLQI